MAKQLVPNTARIDVIGTVYDVPWVATHYSRDTIVGWSALKLQALIDRVQLWYQDTMKTNLGGAWAVREYVANDQGADPGVTVVETNPAPVFGTRVGETASGMIAGLAIWPGATGNLPRKGHTFYPGFVEEDIDGNNLDATVAANVRNHLEQLRDGINSTGETMVIVSRYLGRSLVAKPNGETVFKPTKRAQGVTNAVGTPLMRQLLASQRDRRSVSD